ncbi:MAG TPA: hypothetical protein VMU34_25825 [Mycobacterium sp.]|nr:hypothetical protein [Mycobacterium sp.]
MATPAQIRMLLATQDWPSRGIAVRIANYLEDGRQLVAALSLAAQFAHRGKTKAPQRTASPVQKPPPGCTTSFCRPSSTSSSAFVS